MRTLRVPRIDAILASSTAATISIPVKVDWPELQLTEAQMLANGMALVAGEPDPYPDPSIIDVQLVRSKIRPLPTEPEHTPRHHWWSRKR